MPLLFRLTLALGAVPLVTGSVIYWTWRATGWQFLERAGMLTVILGIVAVLAGAVLLIRHLWRESRAAQEGARGPLWAQGALAGTLLLLNFPVAAFYTLSAMEVSTRYTVGVENRSESAIESFVLTGPGVEIQIGPLAPGATAQRHLHFRGDGALRFTARQQGNEFSGELEGYVTSGLGGRKTIHVVRPGVFEITGSEAAQPSR